MKLILEAIKSLLRHTERKITEVAAVAGQAQAAADKWQFCDTEIVYDGGRVFSFAREIPDYGGDSRLVWAVYPYAETAANGTPLAGCSNLLVADVSGLAEIPSGFFQKCSKLTTVILGESLSRVPIRLFADTALYNDKSNWTEGVLYVSKWLIVASGNFSGECVIASGTVGIADYAFESRSNLTSVTIPDSVKSISFAAFHYCTGLTRATIGKGVTSIGKFAFAGCTSLTTFIYNGTTEQWSAITKETGWKANGVPATEVVCSDGTVAL